MEQDSSFQKRVEIRKRERKGGKHIRKRNIHIYKREREMEVREKRIVRID